MILLYTCTDMHRHLKTLVGHLLFYSEINSYSNYLALALERGK